MKIKYRIRILIVIEIALFIEITRSVTLESKASVGSIQTLKFTEDASVGSESTCGDFILDTSKLGDGSKCNLTDSRTLEIKYGRMSEVGVTTISLKDSAFSTAITNPIFARPNLPSISFAEDTTKDEYSGYTATITILVRSNNSPNLGYLWHYGAYPIGTQPGFNDSEPYQTTTQTVDYSQLEAGTYSIDIMIGDRNNPAYNYTIQTSSFEVYISCEITCRTIKFITTSEMGPIDKNICPSCGDLVNGAGSEDSFESCVSDTTGIHMKYNTGSKGNTQLSLRKECFTGELDTQLPSCIIDNFPTFTLEEYETKMQFTQDYVLIPEYTPADMGGLFYIDYDRISGPEDINAKIDHGLHKVNITHGSLGGGHYLINATLGLICEPGVPWYSLTYNFKYGTFLASSEIIGSILSITLTDNGVTSTLGGTNCSNYLDSSSVTKTGSSSKCSMSGKVITISFGSTSNLGSSPSNIKLKEDGYNTGVFAEVEMQTLPTLALTSSITNDTTITNEDFPLTLTTTLTNITGSPSWTYLWVCSGTAQCPDLTGQTSNTLQLTSNQFIPANYSLIPTISQLNTDVFALQDQIHFKFIVKFNTLSRHSNRLKLATGGYLFNLTMTCSTIFTSTELNKLGTYDDATSCTHTNATDYIYIHLGADSPLKLGDNIYLQYTDYFEDYTITLAADSMTFTSAVIGSVQTITFSENVELVNGDTCVELLTANSNTHLGEGTACSLISSTTLVIKYGTNPLAGTPTLSLRSEGFHTGTVTGDFSRPLLPTFSLGTDQTKDAYMDHIATITLSEVNTHNQEMRYRWSYLMFPNGGNKQEVSSLPTDTKTLDLNYYEMDAGEYIIKIEMTDPDNTAYIYTQQTSQFSVRESCQVNDCDTVIWVFTNDPGSCASECVSGYHVAYDTFLFEESGSGPYTIKAIYQPGSRGGNPLSLVPEKFNNLHSRACGSSLTFPYMRITKDAPETQFSTSDLTLSVELTENGLSLGTNFTQIWDSPPAITCAGGSSSCTISSNSLTIGGPYQFSVKLLLVCRSSRKWNEVIFKSFAYSDNYEISTLGSIQTITFYSNIDKVNTESCFDLISDESRAYLGTSPICSLSTSDTTIMIIKYGSLTEAGPQIISLKSAGFNPPITVSFSRPIMPKFTLEATNTDQPAYQDNIGKFSVGSVVSTGDTMPEYTYTWSYITTPADSIKPDLSALTATQFDFNYWEMTPGDYKIKVRMTQEENAAFYYEEESGEFTILDSCSSDCDTISWKFTNDPGSCSSLCMTGHDSTYDTFEFSTEGDASPYTVNIKYLPGSHGGKNLSLDDAKYNNLHNVPCGIDIKFPFMTLKEDANKFQLLSEDITLSVNLNSNSLVLDTNFYLLWVKPNDMISCQHGPGGEIICVMGCPDGEISCFIEAGKLSSNPGGPYTFKTQLQMLCHGGALPVWSDVEFQEFYYYSNTYSASNSTGSTQIVTFSSASATSNVENNCDEFLTDISTLGTESDCTLTSSTTLQIKYGRGASTSTLSLNPLSFAPYVVGSFNTPSLPSFDLSSNTMIDNYMDYTGTITLGNIQLNGNNDMYYQYTYDTTPGSNHPDLSTLSPQATSMSLKYFEMDPGSYIIKITMLDPSNTYYGYVKETEFVILESCTSNCDTITWRLHNDPGSCTISCIKDHNPTDDFEISQEGEGPYIISATYKPGSVGGRNLSIDPSKNNNVHSGSCGEDIKFPSIKGVNYPPDIHLTGSPLTLSVEIANNDLVLDTDFMESWITPTGITCPDSSDSCTISSTDLVESDDGYNFSVHLTMTCQDEEAAPWTELIFKEFFCSSTFTVATVGSIQTITFMKDLSAVDSTCQALLTSESIPLLGVNAECSLPTARTLQIKYGSGTTATSINITLNSSGFTTTGEGISGSFPRPPLPKFTLNTMNIAPAYQDNIATFTAENIVNTGQAVFIYNWSYVSYPSLSYNPDLTLVSGTSLNLNYWEMSAGNYQIKVRMTQSENNVFYFEEISPVFEVKESCSASCDIVTWTFTNNPGFCTNECLTGHNIIYDTFLYVTSGSGPYTIQAIYQSGSRGGNPLALIPHKFNNLHLPSCGTSLIFPYITIKHDAPQVQLSSSELRLSLNIIDNGHDLEEDLEVKWENDAEMTCTSTTDSCIIPTNGDLAEGGPYSFIAQLSLTCSTTEVWSEVQFGKFVYSADFAVSTLGSIQTITFTNSVSLSTPNADLCSDLLSPISLLHLGVGYHCSLPSSTTMIIKYGASTVIGYQIIEIRSEGFNPGITLSFPRPKLPRFRLEITNIDIPSYQDNIGMFKVESIVNIGKAPLEYEWRFTTYPALAIKPDLTTVTATSLNLNYWEMSPGNYKIKVRMTQEENAAFYYEEESGEFTILDSCSSDCDTISWKFTNDPGSCSSLCMTGHDSTYDTFEFSTEGDASPYTVNIKYLPGSHGGNDLSLDDAKYNNLHNVPCGIDIKFPSITMEKNTPEVQYSESPLTISVIVEKNGFAEGTGYSTSWIVPEGPNCEDDFNNCTISKGELATGGIYILKKQLFVDCVSIGEVWSEVIFNPFIYSAEFAVSTEGSIQTIKFSSIVKLEVVDEDSCEDLLTAESIPHLGTGYHCDLTSPITLIIMYGRDTDTESHTISLRAEGFKDGFKPPSTASFPRPVLPRFSLQSVYEDNYQDYIATFSVTNIIKQGDPEQEFVWSYIKYPASSPKPDLAAISGTSVTFNYFEAAPGTYNLKIRMLETDNQEFYYEEESGEFIVKESCYTDCNKISWTFSRNPGSCTEGCVTGLDLEYDSVQMTTSGSGPYYVTATYLEGSRGGNDLRINPKRFNNLQNALCGYQIAFPSVEIAQNIPEIVPVNLDIMFSVTINSNGLTLDSNFIRHWVQPQNNCLDSSNSCTILNTDLDHANQYTFKTQLNLSCINEGSGGFWTEAVFNKLIYSLYLTSVTSIGSIQTIVFEPVLSLNLNTNCSELIHQDSIVHLGEGANCSLSDKILIIKYGMMIDTSAQIITTGSMIPPHYSCSFPRPNLPSFEIILNTTKNSLPDYTGRVSLGNIHRNGEPTIGSYFIWEYDQHPSTGNTTLPNPVDVITTTHDFNYWEMGEGNWNIKITMADKNNLLYGISKVTEVFEILNSCSLNCRTVEFLSTEERGLIDKSICATCKDLVNGADPEDSFESCIETPSKISLVYSPGSKGNSELSLKKECFPEGLSARNVNLPPCPAIDYFPHLTQEAYENKMQFTSSYLLSPTMLRLLKSNWKWEVTQGSQDIENLFNEIDKEIDISAGANIKGSYQLCLSVNLTCHAKLWDSITYTFNYGTYKDSSEIVGSILSITLTDNGVTNTLGGTNCSNYLDSSSATKTGSSSKCSMSGKVITISFGSTSNLGSSPSNIKLKEDGYNTGVFAEVEMQTLPTLALTSSITNDTTITNEDFPLTLTTTLTNITGSPSWTYLWVCSGTAQCPDLTGQTSNTLQLTSNQFIPANYSLIPTISQLNTDVFALQDQIHFKFIIKFLTSTHNGNRIKLSTDGYYFNMTVTCDLIFESTELTKLGTYDNTTSCVHINNTDSLSIYLSADSGLVSGDKLYVKYTNYFDNYTITIQHNFMNVSTISNIGSVQDVTFTGDVSASSVSTCTTFVKTESLIHLGINPECYIHNANTLRIKYGQEVPSGTQTIHLNKDGVGIVAEIDRPLLPTFNISSSELLDTYMDHIANISLVDIHTNNQNGFLYSWFYATSPSGANVQDLVSLPNDTTSIQLNYYQLDPGNYKIKISMGDPDNIYFKYSQNTTQFTVLESCTDDGCKTITWTLKNDPVYCNKLCAKGDIYSNDTFEFVLSGTAPGPYYVTATYQPESRGGQDLSLNPSKFTNGLNSGSCGSNLKFPYTTIKDAPPNVIPSNTDLTISVDLESNGGVRGSTFKEVWDLPSGVTCADNTNSCTIVAGQLATGGTYIFKNQLLLICHSITDVWTETAFQPVIFSGNYIVSTIGSVQTITFGSSVSAAGQISCADLVSAESISLLGTGSSCDLPTSTSMSIKYGHSTSYIYETISLKADGFNPQITVSFPRPNLPKFSLQSTGADKPYYQDNVATFTLGEIVNNGDATLAYEWTYLTSPVDSTKPQLSAALNSFEFNYWEMSMGEYKIRVEQRDSENTGFWYREITTFIVKDSCGTTCDKVMFHFTNNPGNCETNCVTGYDSNVDQLIFITQVEGEHYRMDAIYQIGSVGGNNLNIVPENMNNLHSVPCGEEIKFPSIRINLDSPDIHPGSKPLTLSTDLTPNGLTLGTHFTETWIHPSTLVDCQDGANSCLISAGKLVDGNRYTFKVQLKLKCQLNPVIWDEAVFREFEYSALNVVITSIGSIQTITFADTVDPSGTGTCEEFILASTIEHLGIGAKCSLSNNILEIKYGKEMIPGEQRISLRPKGFTSEQVIDTFFNRPTNLPMFEISGGCIDSYYDYSDIVSLTNLKENGQSLMEYVWSYVVVPATGSRPDLSALPKNSTSFNMKYKEMGIGEYKLRVTMTDPDNPYFSYIVNTTQFTVLLSCSPDADCQTISWFFYNDPQATCTEGCVTGHHDTLDSLQFSVSGDSPYVFSAKYLPGSIGGNNLTLVSTQINNLDSFSCGETIIFPRLEIDQDAPYIQSVLQPLTLSTTLTSNTLTMGSDFDLTWVAPSGPTCNSNSDSCTIGAGELAQGGPYTFKIQLSIKCMENAIWKELTFKPLHYSNILRNITSKGSKQKITFSIKLTATGGSTCSDFFENDSIQYLGTDAVCLLLSSYVIQIQYGLVTNPEAHIIRIRSEGFEGTVSGSFWSPSLPSFEVVEDSTKTGYMDYIGKVSIGNIEKNNQEDSDVGFIWLYKTFPSGSLPSPLEPGEDEREGIALPYPNTVNYDRKTFDYEYSKMPIGEYQIDIAMIDKDNLKYQRVVHINQFEVLDSCNVSCRTVQFLTTDDIRGNIDKTACPTCLSLVHGAHAQDDSFQTCDETPQKISMVYAVGSKGNTPLSLRKECFTGTGQLLQRNIDLPACQPIDYFPTLTQGTYQNNMSFPQSYVLAPTYTPTDPVKLIKLKLLWERKSGGTDIDSILSQNPGYTLSLDPSYTKGSYSINAKMALICDIDNPWKVITYTFNYGTYKDSSEIVGSILSITLTDNGVTNTLGGTNCSNYLDSSSATKTGSSSKCSMSGKVITISFGSTSNLGSSPSNIKLKEDGYNTGVFAEVEMQTLPTLALTSSITNDTTITNEDFPLTLTTTLTNITGSPSWTYLWVCSGTAQCPDLTGQTSNTLQLTSNQFIPANYSLIPTISQLNTDVFALQDQIHFKFIIKFNTLSRHSNRLKLATGGYLFNLTMTCSTIFTSTELNKLGTYDDATSCTHTNATDYIYIYLGSDSTLLAGHSLNIKYTDYFEDYSITMSQDIMGFTISMEGSVQSITFSEDVSAVAGDTCEDLIEAGSLTDLGSNPSCSLDGRTLVIEYSPISTTGAQPTITLRTEGFQTGTVTGNFTKPYLPTFSLGTDETKDAYMDHVATITVSEINAHNQDMSYTWSYLTSPSGGNKPDLTSLPTSTKTFNLNYYEMDAGDYSINIQMQDPENTVYIYSQQTSQFTVNESCATDCETITWTFTNSIGSCTDGCVTGHDSNYDEFTYQITQGNSENPTTLKAIYQPGSRGGNNLTLVSEKLNNLHSGSCGSSIKFPFMDINQDASSEQPASLDFTLSVSVTNNGNILDTDFEQVWMTEEGVCTESTDSCLIPKGALTVGNTYRFKVELSMKCVAPPITWARVIFRRFEYVHFTVEISGSIQLIEFKTSISASNGNTCAELLTAESIPHLGTEAICDLGSDLLSIKYGYGTIEGEQTITLRKEGFHPVTEGKFLRPTLPRFTMISTNTNSPAYQDNIASFTAGSIINVGSAPVEYKWEYVDSPVSSSKPELPTESLTTISLNYWEMTPGDYKIQLTLTQSNNIGFYYKDSSEEFSVLESCDVDCDTVIWRMSSDPGTCTSDCLTGIQTGDTFDVTTSGTGPYNISAKHHPGNKGGTALSILPTNFNSLHSIPCGNYIIFPTITINENAGEIEYSDRSFDLSGSIVNKGLVLDSEYTLTWVTPNAFTGSPCTGSSCTISPEALPVGGAYDFKLQLKIVCVGDIVWREIEFKEFEYTDAETGSPQLTSNKAQGIGLQTIFTFTAKKFKEKDGKSVRYKFKARIVGGDSDIELSTAFGSKSTLSTTLPAGKESNGFIVLVSVVALSNGIEETESISVKVEKKEGGYSADFVSGLLNSGTTDDKLGVLAMVSSLAVSDKAPTLDGSCGPCATDYGKCNSLTFICVCDPGYAAPDCALTTQKAQENKKLQRVILDSIDTLLDGDLTSDQLSIILDISSQASGGASLGDTQANKKLEQIEGKLIAKIDLGDSTRRLLSGGLIDVETAAPSLFLLISGSLGGLKAENSDASTETPQALELRQNKRIENLKLVSNLLLKKSEIGITLTPIIAPNLEMTGIINIGSALGGKSISTISGPKVTLSKNIGGGNDGETFRIGYINLKINPHLSNGKIPLSNSLEIWVSDGKIRSNMDDPMKLVFKLKRTSEGDPGGCGYYDSGSGIYSEDGMKQVETSSSSITCESKHLSEFTIVPFKVIPEEEESTDQPPIVDDTDGGDGGGGGSNTTMIIIIVVVVVVVVAVVIAVIVYCVKRKKTPESDSQTVSRSSAYATEAPRPRDEEVGRPEERKAEQVEVVTKTEENKGSDRDLMESEGNLEGKGRKLGRKDKDKDKDVREVRDASSSDSERNEDSIDISIKERGSELDIGVEEVKAEERSIPPAIVVTMDSWPELSKEGERQGSVMELVESGSVEGIKEAVHGDSLAPGTPPAMSETSLTHNAGEEKSQGGGISGGKQSVAQLLNVEGDDDDDEFEKLPSVDLEYSSKVRSVGHPQEEEPIHVHTLNLDKSPNDLVVDFSYDDEDEQERDKEYL